MKRCFRCKLKLPLFMFSKTKVEHILKNASAKGRGFSCHLCTLKLCVSWRRAYELIEENAELKTKVERLEKKIVRLEK